MSELMSMGPLILALLLAIYFLPFIVSPLLKVIMVVWGFFVGRRRRMYIEVRYPSGSGTNQDRVDSPEHQQSAADREFQNLQRAHEEKLGVISTKLDEIRDRQEKIDTWYTRRREAASKTMLPGRAFENVVSKINRETGKDVLLFLGIALFLIVDTLIAQQIFGTLGWAQGSLKWGDISIPYTGLYGLFLTLVSVFLLHVFWPRDRFREFGRTSRVGIALGVFVLLEFFVVRLVSVLWPDLADRLMEVVLLTCWIIGIVVVYWLMGEIVGDEADWFKLLVAVAAPLVIVFVVIFGSLFLLQLVLEWGFSQLCSAWYELRRARTVRQQRNAEEVHQSVKRGFYRGLTL